MSGIVECGACYAVAYPAGNYVGVRLRYEPRRIRVDAITEAPVSPVTLLLDPLVRRLGRRLTVWDFDKGAARTMYEGALVDVQPIQAPQELTGWQVVDAGGIAVPCCDEEFAKGYCAARVTPAVAVSFRLPDLSGNFHCQG